MTHSISICLERAIRTDILRNGIPLAAITSSLIFALFAQPALSAVLPDPAIFATDAAYPIAIVPPGTYSYSYGAGNSAEIVGVLSDSPAYASSSISDFAGDYGSTYAYVKYYIVISGPASVLVPLTITTSLDTYGSGGSYYALADLYYNNTRITACSSSTDQSVECTTPADVLGANFVGTMDFNALSNSMIPILLQTSVGARNGSAFASVDPMIEIDPNFSDAGLYTLLISPGIGNQVGSPNPVPEPATLALLVLGLAGLGVTRYRTVGQRPTSV